MGDPYNYYYAWAQNVHYQIREYQRYLKPIERQSYTCEKCSKEYTNVLSTRHVCHYCHKTYGNCCRGKYGVCTQCWHPLSATEKSAQKKRYQKIVVKAILQASIVLPFIFFGVLGGILLATVGTAVGLPVLLVGEFGSVAILTVVLIRKTVDVKAQRKLREKRKNQRKEFTKYEKLAIYSLIGLLVFIIVVPIIILLVVLN